MLYSLNTIGSILALACLQVSLCCFLQAPVSWHLSCTIYIWQSCQVSHHWQAESTGISYSAEQIMQHEVQQCLHITASPGGKNLVSIM